MMNRPKRRIAGLAGAVFALVLLTLNLAGCTSWRYRATDPVASPPPPEGDAAAAVSSEISAPASAGTQASQTGVFSTAVPRRTSHLSNYELEIWRDPAFQKRLVGQLAESFIADTEVEPRVTQEERDQLQKVFALIMPDEKEAKLDEDERAKKAARRTADAIGLLNKMIERKTAEAVVYFTLGNIYFQEEQLDRATEAYRTAVAKYPKFRRAWRNLGLVCVRQNDFEKALPALTKVVELGGGDALTYGLLGFSYSSVENSLAAESAYRMAILLDPATMDWKLGLARSLFRQERYADAAALCSRLIANHPDRAELWLLQANAYIGLGQPIKAAENYELVDRLGRSTVDSLNMLGDIYVNEEIYELAVASYVRALEKNPQGRPERALRGAKALTARGAFEETRQLIDRVEVVCGDRLEDADRKDLLKLRARLAVAAGSGAEEARVLEEIVALDPLDGEALILLGQYNTRTGNPEKAIFYYERAANLEEYEADAKVRHAQLLVGQGKYAEALPLLHRAQQIKPRETVQKYLEQVENAVARGGR